MNDDLEILRDIQPQIAPAPHAVHSAARAALMERAAGGAPAPAHRRRFGLPRVGWMAGGLGLVAAAAAVAVVATSGATAPTVANGGRPPAEQQLSGRQVLLAAATTAETAPEGSGTYWHVKTVRMGGSGNESFQYESWTRRDGQSWTRGKKTNGAVVKDTARSRWSLGGPDVSFAQLQRLPADPDALKARIADALRRSDVRTSAGRPNAIMQKQGVFDGLVSLVSTLPAPPKVRAAAFRAIAAYPNVKSIGKVTGGQGLLISPFGRRTRLVVDPATSRVRNTNFFVTADGAEVRIPGSGGASIVAEWTDQLPR